MGAAYRLCFSTTAVESLSGLHHIGAFHEWNQEKVGDVVPTTNALTRPPMSPALRPGLLAVCSPF